MVRPPTEIEVLPHPAEDLSSDDDLLSWILVDQLGCMPNTKLGVHPQQVKFVGPAFKTAEVLTIIQETIIKGDIQGGMQRLAEFHLIKSHLEAKTTAGQRERFIQHLRRYLLTLLPNSRIEIHTTNRYSAVSGHAELAVYATRPLPAGAVLQELQGSVVPLPDAWREEMDLGEEFQEAQEEEEQDSNADEDEGEGESDEDQAGESSIAATARRRTNKEKEIKGARRSDRTKRRDFSIVWSGLKRCFQLFLGPARFLNHDCNPNVELLRQGKYVTFRVVRPIKIGDELTTFYGSDYFGKNNIECLCLTCELGCKGGFTPKPSASASRSRSRSGSVMSLNSTLTPRATSPSSRKPAPQSSLRNALSRISSNETGTGEDASTSSDCQAGPSRSHVNDAEVEEDPSTPVKRGRPRLSALSMRDSPTTESVRSEAEPEPESPSGNTPPRRERYVREAVKNAKPWSFLKRPKKTKPVLVEEELVDDEDEDCVRCATCAKPLHERIWYNNKYFDHCARCVRHSLIFDLPWPAHRANDVLEYPPSHLIPNGYIPPRVSTIALPSLDKNRKKHVEPPPRSPGPETAMERKARRFLAQIAAEDYEIEQLREAAWTAQDSRETQAKALELAKAQAKQAREEAKRLRNENKIKGSGVWQRYEYVSEDELVRREKERAAVTSGTRRGGRFRATEEDEEMKRLAEVERQEELRKRLRLSGVDAGDVEMGDAAAAGAAARGTVADVPNGSGAAGNRMAAGMDLDAKDDGLDENEKAAQAEAESKAIKLEKLAKRLEKAGDAANPIVLGNPLLDGDDGIIEVLDSEIEEYETDDGDSDIEVVQRPGQGLLGRTATARNPTGREQGQGQGSRNARRAGNEHGADADSDSEVVEFTPAFRGGSKLNGSKVDGKKADRLPQDLTKSKNPGGGPVRTQRDEPRLSVGDTASASRSRSPEKSIPQLAKVRGRPKKNTKSPRETVSAGSSRDSTPLVKRRGRPPGTGKHQKAAAAKAARGNGGSGSGSVLDGEEDGDLVSHEQLQPDPLSSQLPAERQSPSGSRSGSGSGSATGSNSSTTDILEQLEITLNGLASPPTTYDWMIETRTAGGEMGFEVIGQGTTPWVPQEALEKYLESEKEKAVGNKDGQSGSMLVSSSMSAASGPSNPRNGTSNPIGQRYSPSSTVKDWRNSSLPAAHPSPSSSSASESAALPEKPKTIPLNLNVQFKRQGITCHGVILDSRSTSNAAAMATTTGSNSSSSPRGRKAAGPWVNGEYRIFGAREAAGQLLDFSKRISSGGRDSTGAADKTQATGSRGTEVSSGSRGGAGLRLLQELGYMTGWESGRGGLPVRRQDSDQLAKEKGRGTGLDAPSSRRDQSGPAIQTSKEKEMEMESRKAGALGKRKEIDHHDGLRTTPPSIREREALSEARRDKGKQRESTLTAERLTGNHTANGVVPTQASDKGKGKEREARIPEHQSRQEELRSMSGSRQPATDLDLDQDREDEEFAERQLLDTVSAAATTTQNPNASPRTLEDWVKLKAGSLPSDPKVAPSRAAFRPYPLSSLPPKATNPASQIVTPHSSTSSRVTMPAPSPTDPAYRALASATRAIGARTSLPSASNSAPIGAHSRSPAAASIFVSTEPKARSSPGANGSPSIKALPKSLGRPIAPKPNVILGDRTIPDQLALASARKVTTTSPIVGSSPGTVNSQSQATVHRRSPYRPLLPQLPSSQPKAVEGSPASVSGSRYGHPTPLFFPKARVSSPQVTQGIPKPATRTLPPINGTGSKSHDRPNGHGGRNGHAEGEVDEDDGSNGASVDDVSAQASLEDGSEEERLDVRNRNGGLASGSASASAVVAVTQLGSVKAKVHVPSGGIVAANGNDKVSLAGSVAGVKRKTDVLDATPRKRAKPMAIAPATDTHQPHFHAVASAASTPSTSSNINVITTPNLATKSSLAPSSSSSAPTAGRLSVILPVRSA